MGLNISIRAFVFIIMLFAIPTFVHAGEKYFRKDGSLMYSGDFKGGKITGKGKSFRKDGSLMYVGEFKNGKVNGKGEYFRKDGALMYAGDFKNSQYNGKGEYFRKDGSLMYAGEFKNGKFNGQGDFYHKDGKTVKYSGNFKDDKFIGILVPPTDHMPPTVANEVSVASEIPVPNEVTVANEVTAVAAKDTSHTARRYGITITPRLWHSRMNENLYPDEAALEEINIPLAGLTVQYSPSTLPDFDFILSGYYGEGSGQMSFGQASGEIEMTRTDLELLVRQRFNQGSNWHLIYGARWIRADQTLDYALTVETALDTASADQEEADQAYAELLTSMQEASDSTFDDALAADALSASIGPGEIINKLCDVFERFVFNDNGEFVLNEANVPESCDIPEETTPESTPSDSEIREIRVALARSSIVQAGNTLTFNGVIKNVSDIYLGELGFGFSTVASENGKHILFANLLGFAGQQNDEIDDGFGNTTKDSYTVYGLDGNIGYQYSFSKSAAMNIRYRFHTMEDDTDGGGTGTATIHGPEAGASYRF